MFFLVSFVFTTSIFSTTQEEEAFYVGEKAFNDEFYDASATLFEKFIKDFPESKLVYKAKLYLAKSLYFQKKYLQALKLLKELLKTSQIKELKDEIYYWLGQVHFQGKNFSQALNYAYKVIRGFSESPFYWWSYYLAGEAYFNLAQYNESEETFQEILKKAKDEELIKKSIMELLKLYYFEGEYRKLIETVDTYLNKFTRKDERAQLLLYKGEGFYGANKWEKALNTFQEGLSLTEDEELKDIFYYRIGKCWLDKEEPDKARDNFDRITSQELKRFSYIEYYIKLDKYQQALDEIQGFLEDFKDSRYLANVYLSKADCLYQLGRLNDALYTYQEILTRFNTIEFRDIRDRAQYGLAWCYLKLGDFKKAIGEFEKTIKFTDDPIVRISAQIQIADAYQEKGMYNLALETYNKILKDYPDNIYSDYIQLQIGILFIKNEKFEEAKLCFKNLEKNFPSSRLIPQANYYLATSYFSQGDYENAMDVLENFLKNFSKDRLAKKAYYLYGKCFFNKGNYKKALEIFQSLSKSDVDKDLKELIFIDKAYTYINLHNYSGAKKTFEDFVKKFPHSQYLPVVYLNLGNLYEESKKLDKAESYFQWIIKNYPDTPYYYEAALALAHIYRRGGKIEEAKKYLKELIESDNKKMVYKAKLYLADILREEGANSEALQIYNSLIKLKGEPVARKAMVEKGFLLKELKEYKKAVSVLRQASEGGVSDPMLYFALGYCLEKVHREDEAISEYFKIIYLYENNLEDKVKAFFRIARIYEKKNKWQEAKEIYQKIIELNVEESRVAEERIKEIEKRAGSKF